MERSKYEHSDDMNDILNDMSICPFGNLSDWEHNAGSVHRDSVKPKPNENCFRKFGFTSNKSDAKREELDDHLLSQY